MKGTRYNDVDRDDIINKLDELVEGYNEIMRRLGKMDRRIAILYHNEPCVDPQIS